MTTSLSASSLQPASRSDLLALERNGRSTNMVATVSQHLIDERHIWISKCITQSFGMLEGDFSQQVESLMSSGTPLERINRFLAPNSPRGLFFLLGTAHPEEVRIVFDPAEVGEWPVKKVLYMVRINSVETAVSADIGNDVLIGQFGPHAIKSFKLMLEQVYGQLLRRTQFPSDFSLDDKRSFFSQLNKFSMTMVDVVQTIDCRVNFRRVAPDVMHRCSTFQYGQATQQDDLRYLEEDIAGQWLSAAEREMESADPTLHSIQDLGPDVPLKHWRERLSHLNSLNEHFESRETRQVLNIWEQHLPAVAEAWSRLEVRLRECTQEANDNVKHLTNLNKFFEVLYNGTPERISQELLTIFSKVKMMRYMSKYLQRDECMTGLLVKIVTQIVMRCKAYIISKDGGKARATTDKADDADATGTEDPAPNTIVVHRGIQRQSSGFSRAESSASGVFSRLGSAATVQGVAASVKRPEVEKETPKDDLWSQSCDNVLSKIEECIKLNHTCQARYREVKQQNAGGSSALKELPFDFDESQIFAKFVHFEQRLKKLDEFFKAYRLFELLNQQNDPGLQSISAEFFKVAEALKSRPYDVLDIKATTFDAEFERICLVIAELERQLQVIFAVGNSHRGVEGNGSDKGTGAERQKKEING